ncbi:MAG: SusD/RagB family nutrient-binding outer membrane lipoprotein [Bacteroidetes bacterium]|nr:SusD/RagB family nutrient-binding outer membrane lipoprotein [Bacteroidota bacterium]
MKLKKLIYVGIASALVLSAGTGCRKSQFNINQNINNPTDSTVAYNVVMPAAMNATGTIVAQQWGTIQNWMGYWARSGTYAPSVLEETYQITTGFGNGIWNNCYNNSYNYQIVISKAAQANATFYQGIGEIMKAFNFQTLVDVYGNVPYSEAMKGSGNPTPKYDNGLDIYKDLFRRIDIGMNLIKNAVVSTTNPNKGIATDDIMFQGNKTKWMKFGNTLKLRMLIHAYAVGAIDKAAEMAIINAEGSGFLGAGEDAMINPGYTGNSKPNPFWNAYKTGSDGTSSTNDVYYKANKWGIEYYKGDGDPRVIVGVAAAGLGAQRIYVAGSDGLVGVPYGLPPNDTYAAAKLAGYGPGIYKSATASQAVITASESLFLQAEARLRGWITSGPTAQALCNSAMDESFRYLEVPSYAAAAQAYRNYNAGFADVDFTAPPVGVGGPTGGLFTILSQKWFALNGINTLEVWCDWRRVPYSEVATKVIGTNSAAPTGTFVYGDGAGYTPGPARSVSPQITPADNIPVRYLYPQSEYNYNTANVAAQGTITRYSRVFWDLN